MEATADLAVWGAWIVTVALARMFRSHSYAVMVAVVLGVISAIWTGLFRAIDPATLPGVRVFQIAVFVHFAFLIRPKLRPLWFRGAVSIPALWFVAGSMLAMPWAVVAAFGITPHGWWAPFAVCALGLVQSFRSPQGTVDITADGSDAGTLARAALDSGSGEPLRIVQITDPHLGPFMSVVRLRKLCQRAVDRDPHLVLITGDILTMESQRDPDAVTRALEPLAEISDRVFACFGNHDHEDRATVREALDRIGATLLVDSDARVDTAVGPVQIIGADFRWRGREAHLSELFESIAPRDGTPRVLMLHDPGAFRHVPDGAADVTFSGHTHGGQLGLVSLGLRWTFVWAVLKSPDYGLWAHGRNRLYVHRGTGHYGYPIRLGVPAEDSLINVWFARES